jgi:monoamine oxidase
MPGCMAQRNMRRGGRGSAASGREVVVIGAGLAGLSAAYHLTKSGAAVRVFEARHRVGGRVYTIRDFRDGQHGEAGGDLIEEGQEAVFDLAEELGLRLGPVLRGGFGLFVRVPRARPQRLTSQDPWWRALAEMCGPEIAAVRALCGHDQSPALRHLASISLAEMLEQRGASRTTQAMAAALRGFFLADSNRLSLLAALEQAAAGAPGRRLFRVEGGNDLLATRLAARLAQPVACGQAAVSVTVGPDGRPRVGLLGDNGDVTQVTADFAVLAIPTVTLGNVAFDPPLPERQAAAIQTLRYGCATKALIQFERPFWRHRGQPRAWATNLKFGAVWDAGEGQPGRHGLLTLLGGGGASAELAGWMVAEGAGLGAELAWLGTPSPFVASHLVQWENDPWARGGYAYMEAGDDPSLRSWLARPYGPVVFAGEHTSLLAQGYMAGAIESGHRAALEIESFAAGLQAISG